VYLLFSKLGLTSLPLLTRRWIPGLNVEALFATTLNIGTIIFIVIQQPYINNSDSRTMTLSQGLLAVIIACGTGSTEVSAGNSSNQTFVIAVVFGLAVPGTIYMAYSVIDPDLGWAKKQWEKQCARQTKPSAAVYPSEGEDTSGEPAQTDRVQMQAEDMEGLGPPMETPLMK